jgi:Lrp/AsnC family transcriptional regulator, leucine-responsive regulatory protein
MLKALNISSDEISISIDTFDLSILRALSANARSLNTEISAMTCLSPSATLRRHRRLEELNIIEGYTTKINFRMLGYRDIIMLEIKFSIITLQIISEIRRIVEFHGKITDFYRCIDEPGFVIFLSVTSAAEAARNLHENLSSIEFINSLKLRLISRINIDDSFFEPPKKNYRPKPSL